MTTFKSLREIVTFRGGGTPSKQVPEYWNGDIPWASVKDFTSTSLSKTQDFISEEGLRNSSANLIPKGHVIIPTRMSLGKAAINTVDLAINQDLRALVPKVPLDTRFLLYAVLSLKSEIVKKGAGATVKGITQEELYKLEIAFPPLGDQTRIAHLLGKIEGLIVQRKHHLQRLDDLLKSIFLEMFGDPVRNEMGWEKKPFSTLLADIESGKSPKCEARKATNKEWGVLKLGAVTRCTYDECENKALPENMTPSVRDEVKAGDLLFSRKNTYELVAACAYVFSTRPRLLMPDLIFRFVFRADSEVNPIYMWKLLTADSQRKKIQSLAAGASGSMPNISKANLREVQLPIPPLPLQDEFSTIVKKIEAIKSSYKQSLSDLENLYGSLSQKAFKGELDLSFINSVEQHVDPNNIRMENNESINNEESSERHRYSRLLATSDGRIELFRHIFEKSIGELNQGEEFDPDLFWINALGDTLEYVDENSGVFGAVEYEKLKIWIFEALNSGDFKQSFDDLTIDIRLRLAP